MSLCNLGTCAFQTCYRLYQLLPHRSPTPRSTHDINTNGIDGTSWAPDCMLSPRDIQQSQLATHEWCLFFGLMSVTIWLVQTRPHQIEFLVFVLVINQAESWFQDILKVGREFTAVNVWLLQRSRSQTREWAEGLPRVLSLSGGPARLWACLAVGPLSQRCLPMCPFCLFGRQVRVKQSWGVVCGENSTHELYTSPWQRNFSFKLKL